MKKRIRIGAPFFSRAGFLFFLPSCFFLTVTGWVLVRIVHNPTFLPWHGIGVAHSLCGSQTTSLRDARIFVWFPFPLAIFILFCYFATNCFCQQSFLETYRLNIKIYKAFFEKCEVIWKQFFSILRTYQIFFQLSVKSSMLQRLTPWFFTVGWPEMLEIGHFKNIQERNFKSPPSLITAVTLKLNLIFVFNF